MCRCGCGIGSAIKSGAFESSLLLCDRTAGGSCSWLCGWPSSKGSMNNDGKNINTVILEEILDYFCYCRVYGSG